MVTTSKFVSQKAFVNFQKLQPKTNQVKKTQNHKKHEKLHHFETKTPKIGLLTLN